MRKLLAALWLLGLSTAALAGSVTLGTNISTLVIPVGSGSVWTVQNQGGSVVRCWISASVPDGTTAPDFTLQPNAERSVKDDVTVYCRSAVSGPVGVNLAPIQAVAGGGGGSSATAANQTTGNNSLASIDTKLGAALPLSTGAATAANQVTANTALATLHTDMIAPTPAGTNSIGSIANITGTISLPTGAATTAKQPALGTAGTPSADVLTVQGTASGTALNVDTVVRAASVDRGAIIGFTGAQITTTSGSATITLTTVPTAGAIVLGQQIAATGVPAGTTINALASGTLNAANSTYTLSVNATATGSAVAATSIGPQQIMAANSARRGTAYQVQSASANIWVNGIGAATADYRSLKIPSSTYYETPTSHVGTGAVAAIADTPATPLYAREW